MNIVLTGFMGTGKTYIGKELSRKLEWKYIDTDEIIETKTGKKIKDIFELKGEKYFRDIETEVIKKVSQLDQHIIATGGGIVLRNENMDYLKKNSIIVNLTASPLTIYNRTKNNSDRPLLNKPDRMLEIKNLLEIREPYYKRCDVRIKTDNLTKEEIIKKILKEHKKLTKKENKLL